MDHFSVPAPTFDAWDVIDQWIDELNRLAREPLTSPAFQGELLRRVVEALAARRASVWEATSGEWMLARTACSPGGPTSAGIDAPSSDVEPALGERRRIVEWAASRSESIALAPSAAASDDDTLVNPTSHTLLVCPWSIDGAAQGVLEVELRAAASPDARQGALRLLSTFAQIAADAQRNRDRITWKQQAAACDELETLVAALHAARDLKPAAYALANEGRRWVGCDRVSVLTFDGARCRAEAVSGVDTIDRRADAVRLLERLVEQAAAQRVEIRSSVHAGELMPQVERALAAYVELAESRDVSLLLLREPSSVAPAAGDARPRKPAAEEDAVVGAIVFERFAGDKLDEVAHRRMSLLQTHGSAAIAHAAALERIPLGRFWRRFTAATTAGDRRRRTILKFAAVCGCVFVVCAAAFLIPAPRTIEAHGTLEPRERRDLFAPSSGIVVDVLDHGAMVKRGTPVARLRKPELEVESARLLGEIQTTERKLSALRANRATAGTADPTERRRRQELDAEEELLGVRLAALRKEQELVAAQEAELTVVAPVDGSVTTWDAKRLLVGKPVERGHPLVSIAELEQPWILELRVPDRRFAEVAQARSAGGEPEVEFIVAADPQAKYTGRLVRLADTARTDARYGTTIAATVEIGDGLTRDAIIRDELRRPGALVNAKIHCGRSSYGANWTADLWHYLRTRWLF